MKTSVGLLDALFGKRVTIELPTPNGESNTVKVIEKWLAKMETEGKVRKVTNLAESADRRSAYRHGRPSSGTISVDLELSAHRQRNDIAAHPQVAQ